MFKNLLHDAVPYFKTTSVSSLVLPIPLSPLQFSSQQLLPSGWIYFTLIFKNYFVYCTHPHIPPEESQLHEDKDFALFTLSPPVCRAVPGHGRHSIYIRYKNAEYANSEILIRPRDLGDYNIQPLSTSNLSPIFQNRTSLLTLIGTVDILYPSEQLNVL